MANRRRKFPTFFSFEIGPVRGIAESMGDEEWGTWSKKALSDLSIGCIRKDTDPRVKEMFNSSKDRMDTEYQRKHEWYEKNKNLKADASTREDEENRKSESGAVAPTTISNSYEQEATRTDGRSMRAGNVARTSVRSSLAYSGRSGLVRLTDDEYNMLLHEVGNKRKADKLIDSLDYSLAEGKTFNATHFQVLMHWNDYREDKAEQRNEEIKAEADARAKANKENGYKSHADRMDEMVAGAQHLIQMYSLPKEARNG